MKIFIFWKFDFFGKCDENPYRIYKDFQFGFFENFGFSEKIKFPKSFFDMIKKCFWSRFFCTICDSSLDSISSKITRVSGEIEHVSGKFRKLVARFAPFWWIWDILAISKWRYRMLKIVKYISYFLVSKLG